MPPFMILKCEFLLCTSSVFLTLLPGRDASRPHSVTGHAPTHPGERERGGERERETFNS